MSETGAPGVAGSNAHACLSISNIRDFGFRDFDAGRGSNTRQVATDGLTLRCVMSHSATDNKRVECPQWFDTAQERVYRQRAVSAYGSAGIAVVEPELRRGGGSAWVSASKWRIGFRAFKP